jgi:hypothetical protein
VDIHAVVLQALSDKKFARKLQSAATKASKAGVGSLEHKRLLKMFEMNEDQVDQMHTVVAAICTISTTVCRAG